MGTFTFMDMSRVEVVVYDAALDDWLAVGVVGNNKLGFLSRSMIRTGTISVRATVGSADVICTGSHPRPIPQSGPFEAFAAFGADTPVQLPIPSIDLDLCLRRHSRCSVCFATPARSGRLAGSCLHCPSHESATLIAPKPPCGLRNSEER